MQTQKSTDIFFFISLTKKTVLAPRRARLSVYRYAVIVIALYVGRVHREPLRI